MNGKNRVASLLLGLAVAVVGLCGPRAAYAAEAEAPSYAGGIRFQNPSFIGIKVARLDVSTPSLTPVLLDSGSGLLYGICRSSGVLGQFALAIDSATASNGASAVSLSHERKISPDVYTSTGSQSFQPVNTTPCWIPPWPVRYELGLVGIESGGGQTGGHTEYYYREDNGTNP